jgi:hypothetical protein
VLGGGGQRRPPPASSLCGVRRPIIWLTIRCRPCWGRAHAWPVPCVPRYHSSLMPGGRICWAAGVFLVLVGSCAGTHSSTDSSAGGSRGEGGSGGESTPTCSELYSQYQVALSLAKTCSLGAAGQCEHMGALVNPGCLSMCMTPVNDTSMLDRLLPEWRDAGCETSPIRTCAAGCLTYLGGTCVSGDGGIGQCVGE